MSKPIDMAPVSSSNISKVGHCSDTNTLAVEFKSGDTYHYHDCPKDAHEAFIGAKSIGSHFHSNIKSNYKYSKQ